jgi:hypothetical protein
MRIGLGVVLVALLVCIPSSRAQIQNCTNIYCTIYDEDGSYLYDEVQRGTIVTTLDAPELADSNLVVQPEGVYYHNDYQPISFSSIVLLGTAHLFVGSSASVTVSGNFTLDQRATLSVGADSIVNVDGELRVQNGALLRAVVNTGKPVVTFTRGAAAFSHLIVVQNTIASEPELMFDRMLCQTPAFVVTEETPVRQRVYVCKGFVPHEESVVIYNRTLIDRAFHEPPTHVTPIPVVIVPPTPTMVVNSSIPCQVTQQSRIYGEIDIVVAHIWPYLITIAVLLGAAIALCVFIYVRTKRTRKKIDSVKILMGGDANDDNSYELKNLDPDTFDDFVHLGSSHGSGDSRGGVSDSSQPEGSLLTDMIIQTSAAMKGDARKDASSSQSHSPMTSYSTSE